MVQCAVFGCSNNSNKKLKKNQGKTPVSFYSFPKDQKICDEWLKFCCRSDKVNVKTARICADHFHETDKHWMLQHQLLKYSPTCSRKIKPNAIPSLNGPKKSIEKSTSQLTREKKMEERVNREKHLDLIRKALFAPVEPSQSLPETCTEHEPDSLPEVYVSSNNNSEALKTKIESLEKENAKLKAELSCYAQQKSG